MDRGAVVSLTVGQHTHEISIEQHYAPTMRVNLYEGANCVISVLECESVLYTFA